MCKRKMTSKKGMVPPTSPIYVLQGLLLYHSLVRAYFTMNDWNFNYNQETSPK